MYDLSSWDWASKKYCILDSVSEGDSRKVRERREFKLNFSYLVEQFRVRSVFVFAVCVQKVSVIQLQLPIFFFKVFETYFNLIRAIYWELLLYFFFMHKSVSFHFGF